MAHLENKIVLFNSSDGDVSLEVLVNANNDEVWLSKEQMALLFGRDRTVISRHISNLYKEGEVDKDSTCAKFAQVQTERTFTAISIMRMLNFRQIL